MSHSHTDSPRKTLLQIAATTLALVLFLMWMEGAFKAKAMPGLAEVQAAESRPSGLTARVERRVQSELLSWPATVAALKVIQIAPKVPGRILEITVRAGQRVTRGQVLARLDDAEVRARLAQTRSALIAAEAGAARHRADAARLRNLYDREAATRQDLDAALAIAKAGDAQVDQARQAIREIESHLGESVLLAPFEGVIDRRVQEPGDMALPGAPILTLLQADTLRVEANVPASCAPFLQMGQTLTARLGAPAHEARVVVDEVQPSNDPLSRTVLVKARLTAQSGAQPGAFAWLQQSCGFETVLVVPAAAVTRIGQLESVRLVVDGQVRLRHVRTGKRFGDEVEILSGLNEGDTVRIAGATP